MSAVIHGDVVAAIPLDNGHTRYQKVGVLLKQDSNDATKGPGFTIMLDRTFSPAGMPGHGASVGLSVYWPKPKEDRPIGPAPAVRPLRPRFDPKNPPDPDDDIPF